MDAWGASPGMAARGAKRGGGGRGGRRPAGRGPPEREREPARDERVGARGSVRGSHHGARTVSSHQHTHDVAVIGDWMEHLDNDPLEIKKSDLVNEALIDFIVGKSAEYNVFFNELVRQTTVHCPKIALLLGKVWIGIFALLDKGVIAFEKQLRSAQQIRAKMMRLVVHTKSKLDNYKAEVDDLKERLDERESEVVDLKVAVKGLERQLSGVQIENEKLKERIMENMRHGADDGNEHSIDYLSSQLDKELDHMDAERRRKLKFMHDEDRLLRHFEMSMVLREKNKQRVVKVHEGTQTEEEEKEVEITIPPPAAPKKKVKGVHIPPNFRICMNSFPKKVRNMTLRGLRRLIMQIYFEKVENDIVHDDANHRRLSIEQFVSEFMYHKYGLANLADHHMSELVQTVRVFHKSDKRVKMFDLFCACVKHRNHQPIVPQALLDFITDVFRKLKDAKELNKESLNRDPDTYMEVRRARAMLISKELFSHVAQPLVVKLAVRVENLPIPQSKDPRKVSLDDYLSLLTIEWAAERSRWEQRLVPLFDHYSQLEDEDTTAAATGGDGEAPGPAKQLFLEPAIPPTTVTEEMKDCIDKACTVSVKSIDASMDRAAVQEMEAAGEVDAVPLALNEALAKVRRAKSVITVDKFREAMHEAEPDLFETKVRAIFEDARTHLEVARWNRQRKPWKEAKDKASGHRFFYNEVTNETAWKMPQLVKEKVMSLDFNTFVEMAFDNGILKSTVDANAVLDVETKAAVFIQRRFRRHLRGVRRAREEQDIARRAESNARSPTSRKKSEPSALTPGDIERTQRITGGQVRVDDDAPGAGADDP